MQALDIPCKVCGAKVKENCNDGSAILLTSHKERLALAAKLPDLPELDSTDKSLITYYAYVIVCDSVAAKSKEMFGKEFNSEQVQRFFAHKAINELRADGLLK